MYEWDSAKAEANKAKHGVEFETAEGFDWTSALILDDEKHSDKSAATARSDLSAIACT